jgi:hypothetical protein
MMKYCVLINPVVSIFPGFLAEWFDTLEDAQSNYKESVGHHGPSNVWLLKNMPPTVTVVFEDEES